MHLLGRCASDVDATQLEGRPAFQQLNPHDWAEHASVRTCLPPTLITSAQRCCSCSASAGRAGVGWVRARRRLRVVVRWGVGQPHALRRCTRQLALRPRDPRARPRSGCGFAPRPPFRPVRGPPRRTGASSAASVTQRWGSRPHEPRSDALAARGRAHLARQPAVQRHHPGPLAAARRALPTPRVALGQSASRGQIGAPRGPRSAAPLGPGAWACGVTCLAGDESATLPDHEHQ